MIHKHCFAFGLNIAGFLFFGLFFSACASKERQQRILVFSKTADYHHESISAGNTAIQQLGNRNHIIVDTTTDANIFNEDSLKNYSAIVFLNTTGDVLDYFQEAAFERYIQAGGGYVGIHAAADCEYDWGWYGRLVGAYFLDHPGINDSFPNVQQALLTIVDTNHLATKNIHGNWKRTDEFYSFKKISKDINVLINIEESSYNGGKNGKNHPMAWFHEYDGGRAFYTEFGHTDATYSEPQFLQHLLGGIQYAIGKNKPLDYSKATSQFPPEDSRFTKTILTQGSFFEPTEMTVLPNLDVLVIQRRGEVMLFKNETKTLKQVGFLNVYYKAITHDYNIEEGVLGLVKDPDFRTNNWVYIYYSPVGTSVNRLSRFNFQNDKLDNATEKIILEVPTEREICCHTGGSLAFGPDKLLYLSTGDNTTPFDESGAKYVNSGFAPLNDFSPNQKYDARRSAGNSNDLRGKILRINVRDDGSYTIPDGNLFTKGTPKTRPEIYVMGNRNPYRISVDQITNYLYWGEVGPDADKDSLNTRGPRGYDEINQARRAGFFGWPFFAGDNAPYREYDYKTGLSGANFNTAKPLNTSKHNTGIVELPPAQPAFIWYSFGYSTQFPQVGTGGKTSLAGPVYYSELFPKESRLPDYYNGKLFIYDWIRGWLKAVTMLPNGDFNKLEPFFPSMKLNALIDVELGPDGKLYLLEYGNGWYSKNPDAGLARIDYNGGNRPPVINTIKVNKTSGLVPFSVKLTVGAKDLENDKITYHWNLGDGKTVETTVPELSYTYKKIGDFKIIVEAKDAKGAAAKSNELTVYAGNEAPQVSISIIKGNKSFYMPGIPVEYKVSIQDKNDGNQTDLSNLFVSFDYMAGFDKASLTTGHQQGQTNISGKNIMMLLDCKSCHKEIEKSIGPSFLQVATKYAKDLNALPYLTQKIIKGGSGVWGEIAMSAHPNLKQEDAQQIVSWILSLADKKTVKKSLPMVGSIIPPLQIDASKFLVLSASYTDNGNEQAMPLTGSQTITLGSNKLLFTGREIKKGFTKAFANDMQVLKLPAESGWFAINPIDLTGVGSILLQVSCQAAATANLHFEARLDSLNGKLITSGTHLIQAKDLKQGMIKLPLKTTADGKLHSIYFSCKINGEIVGEISGLQCNPN